MVVNTTRHSKTLDKLMSPGKESSRLRVNVVKHSPAITVFEEEHLKINVINKMHARLKPRSLFV